jgi:hypothetical protein
VDVEGPNRLGGFRLSDGGHRVALSYVPSRKNDGRDWWVTAWVPAAHEADGGATMTAAPEEAQNPRTQRREIALPAPMERDDAVIAAVQLLVEQRIRAAWRRVTQERDEALAWMMSETIAAIAQQGQAAAAESPAPTPPVAGSVFGTARSRVKPTTNGNGAAAAMALTAATADEDEFDGM